MRWLDVRGPLLFQSKKRKHNSVRSVFLVAVVAVAAAVGSFRVCRAELSKQFHKK